jgi:UDP-glucose:glycoprotein glucosyltransferase
MRASVLRTGGAFALSLRCLLGADGVNAANSVNVALQTSFDAAPFLIELLETAATENPAAYFPLLDQIAKGTFADATTDKDLYDLFVQVLQKENYLQDEESLSSFKFALGLHEAAPRIQAHFQYYNSSIEPHMMAAQDAACPVWVHFDGQQYCSPTLERAQQPVSIEESDEVLPFDRVLGPRDAPSSIIYADITHPLFADFHNTIAETAREGKTSYRIRYRPAEKQAEPVPLSGYGVELNLKRTDYIVIDDREAGATEGVKEDLKEPDAEDDLEIKPLTTSELYNLGVNAASWIAASSDPMQALLQVTTDFPKYSSFLASQEASQEFVDEHVSNREILLPAGYNALWINGLQIENRQVNAYSMLDHLRRERKLIGQMKEIGLTSTQAVDILAHEVIAESAQNAVEHRFDWRDDAEGNDVIIFMNDLEQDKRYAGWPTTLTGLFQRTYPGQLPSVAKDIHNIIVPFHVDDIKELELVVTALQSLVKRKVPVRIGIVPIGSTKPAETYSKLSYHLLETYGLTTLLSFYSDVVKAGKILPDPEKQFAVSIKDRKIRQDRVAFTYASVLTDEDLSQRLVQRDAYIDRLALHGAMPPFVVNGVVLPRVESWFEMMSQRVYMDQQVIMQVVYGGSLPEDGSARDYFMADAISRRNELIIPHDPKAIKIVDVAALAADHAEVFASMPRFLGADAALMADRAHLLLVSDLNSEEGNRLARAVLEFQSKVPEAEILLVHNAAEESEQVVSAEIFEWQRRNGPRVSEQHRGEIQAILAGTKVEAESPGNVQDAATQFWAQALGLVKALGLNAGQNGLWLNGRMLGPIPRSLTVDDLQLLLDFERTSRLAPVTTAITALGLEDKFTEPLDVAKITAVVSRSQKSELPEGMRDNSPLLRLDRYKLWKDSHTAIKVGSRENPTIQIVAIVDPVAEATQPWVSVLNTLSKLEGVSLKIFLNPRGQLTELPSKRFYRQVLSSSPEFDADGSLEAPKASFEKLPDNVLFNLGLIVPPSWLVAPRDSVDDLDNIKFSGTEADVHAVYELEHILIEGHARDLTASPPPRGVQLLLGTNEEPHFTDTIIMANLGYFQFKANPGYWQISLKPGRSSKIYHLDSVGSEGYAAVPGDETTSVALLSFQGVTLFPRLSRKPGMEDADVLETAAPGSAMDFLNKGASFASSALSSLGIKTGSTTNADINIFSVASGHLYERMLNIMMVSVMKHTKHTVKFWFIEQFLSPAFKSTLPSLAEHYGFEYEMVTYKWPHWLRGQKEKQREIWGYKILFLDVLFPLDLDKVIFVDADQIVRTDMMELNKVDLQGAPYGFTPMCDSRTEMEGFRFWKQGYWETYLRGKPYHISALYVIDLKKFRELAAGDRLRQQYHSLSADPASLSNLDQDLPNHMQHNLPIHSLPQEWLWCETWCSDESFKDAKTIDLCNNPQTKEPKLDRARRQVPEWTEYDNEIREVIAKAKGEVPAMQRADDSVKQEHAQEPLKKDEL